MLARPGSCSGVNRESTVVGWQERSASLVVKHKMYNEANTNVIFSPHTVK